MRRNRFEKKRKLQGGIWRTLLPAVTFGVVFAFVLGNVHQIGQTTEEEERKSLSRAVHQSVVQCYALEGRYPESLEYLKTHYGITYDSSKYMVSYQAYGSNMLPTVTVLPVEGGKR